MGDEPLHYDAIIIGSGQGGNPLAQALAKLGQHVALIESDQLGGTCVNTGCTPTKTMVASAQVAHYARNAARWGVRAGHVEVDLPAILKRKDERVTASRTGWEKSVNGDKEPEWLRGRARFIGARQVQVGEKIVEAQRVFLDTGCVPTIPSIDGLSAVPYLTNVSIMEIEQIPQHLLVLGGGYVGLEFAQMYRRFGSEVTVIQNGKQILPREDEDVAATLQQALEAEGVTFHLEARATKAQSHTGEIELTIEKKSGRETLTGSHLLVAVGRTPQTKDLALEKTGVEVDANGFIAVNDRLETTAPGIWAIGDVTGGPAFTHISYNDFQIVYGNLYEGKQLSTKTRIVPYAVFTDPALGRVGLTEKEARRQGLKLKVGKVPMSRVARALERAETAGLMKVVVDAASDKVLGAAILSTEGGETVQIFSTLILTDKPYTLLRGAIYIHPTFAEGLFTLLDSIAPVE
ncbi:MAG: mercuric reductase [Acidobacteriota bacterium]|nr:mercuric reductase [Acidobacteriota bacterium]